MQNVTVAFDHGLPVLENVNFSVDEGDFIAITGPNGGGKTTMLRVILKLLRPTSGQIIYRWNNSIVKSLSIGYLPQKNMIDSYFPITVRETVESGFMGNGCSKDRLARKEAFDRVVDLMGIGDYLDSPIGILSGGQLQRTLFGRALISSPEVIVLDEPLSYVDKSFEKNIYSVVEQVARNTTILLVSHEMSVISAMANRHLIVDHGLHECTALHHYVPDDCN